MAPPRGGGEASLKEQKEAGLEQGEGESGQESVLIRPLAPGGGLWDSSGLGPPAPSIPMLGAEPVAMANRGGRLRKREGWSPPPGTPDPPMSM